MTAATLAEQLPTCATLAQALAAACAQGVDRLDAQILMLLALLRDRSERAWLLGHDQEPLVESVAQRYATLCQRRLDGEPLAYISGWHAFYGLELAVDSRVLDPRADTETLVDWALSLALPTNAHVADLGTGSGAIALALKSQRTAWSVTACDASADALAVAQANARRLGLQIEFAHGNWWQALAGQRFDVVVSNPPYIAADDPHLAALSHEPTQALVSGADGLDALRAIVNGAAPQLTPGAWLLLEHGWQQAAAVRSLLQAAGFTQVQSKCDLAGIERVSGGQWPTRS